MAALEPYYNAYQSKGGNITVVDIVPADMLYMIDPHWYKYPPMDPIWHIIIGVIMVIMSIISLIGNGMVILIFTTTKNLLTPSNILIVNLAFSDFWMMATNAVPMAINAYYEQWVFGPLMCELYAVCGSCLGFVSIWTMAIISFDRYNVIVRGMSGRPLTTSHAILRCVIIWTTAGVWSTLPLFGWNRYVPEGNMTCCGTDYLNKNFYSRAYIFLYAMFVYYMPLFCICFSYYFILKTVFAHEAAMREQAKKMNVASLRSSEDANKSTEAKLAKVALMTIFLWFMAWTPYLAINFAGIFGARHLSPMATVWGAVFSKLGACINPVVYGASHPKYRIALNERFPTLARCCKEEEKPAKDAQSNASGATEENVQEA